MRKVEIEKQLSLVQKIITNQVKELNLAKTENERREIRAEYGKYKEQEVFLQEQLEKLSARAKRMRENSNLGSRFLKRTFQTFERAGLEKAYEQCRTFAEQFENNEGQGLLIMGTYGTGKTHLAAAITNYIIDNYEIPVRFITSVELLDYLKEFGSESSKVYLEEAKKIDLLVIDDLGKEKVTEWVEEKLFQIINARYENELPIVITTNHNQQKLKEQVGGAVFSRLCEMCDRVIVTGKDRRTGE